MDLKSVLCSKTVSCHVVTNENNYHDVESRSRMVNKQKHQHFVLSDHCVCAARVAHQPNCNSLFSPNIYVRLSRFRTVTHSHNPNEPV